MIKSLSDLAFLVYAGFATALLVRMYFWADIKAWWERWQERRQESERLNKLWEAGGFEE